MKELDSLYKVIFSASYHVLMMSLLGVAARKVNIYAFVERWEKHPDKILTIFCFSSNILTPSRFLTALLGKPNKQADTQEPNQSITLAYLTQERYYSNHIDGDLFMKICLCSRIGELRWD